MSPCLQEVTSCPQCPSPLNAHTLPGTAGRHIRQIRGNYIKEGEDNHVSSM